jgi:hypothetical protein
MFKLVSWAFGSWYQAPTEAPRLAKPREARDIALTEDLWHAEALYWECERLKRQAVIEATTPEVIAAWTAASDKRAWSRRMHDAKRAKKAK